MNGRDEFQTGVGADASPPEADDGTTAKPAAKPAAVHDVPDSGANASGMSSFDSSTNTPPPPLKSSRSNGLWGYQVPDSVQNALTPLEPVGKQYLAWIGSILLLVGTFLSVKTYTYNGPNLGLNVGIPSASQNFWDFSGIWAFIVLVLALGSAGLAYIRDYKWLVVTGGVSFLILVLNFLFTFSGTLGLSARPSWGWIVLFLGALLIMAAGAMRSTARDAENENGLNNIIASVQNRGSNR
jgi:hypothetical protein